MRHREKEEEEEKREPETFFDLDPIKQQHESVCAVGRWKSQNEKACRDITLYLYTIM